MTYRRECNGSNDRTIPTSESDMSEATPATRVVAAANRLASGLIVVGVRHHDKIMNEQIRASGENHHYSEQGFIDNRGNFLSREDALALAIQGDQINKMRPKTEPTWKLFSEDLY